MARCEECIYHKMCYWIALFNEKTPCEHFLSTADVAPKSEVATKLFEDLEKILCLCDTDGCLKVTALYTDYVELKKKYTEGKT